MSEEIPDSCRFADNDCDSSVFDGDDSESNVPSSESGLSTQDSNLSINRGGRPVKQKRKRGPGRGKKELGK